MPRGDGTGPAGPGSGRGRGMSRAASRGRGRMGGSFAAGPAENCICPNCAAVVPYAVGQPCNARSCPRCGTKMTRV